ncbi:uncharacterized protein Z519_09824 [Cladophialophora bantiana CBS 173.52]|uniref:Uncharacterized protein n=1 Tax=Cladophialophora bantiana (strain ATCC 10958 / CBS 173.52 / CDC B-1940 / NIH 8579) TaxID=1442370 RepID=A0A0D2H8T0_CLAB1|nr:uncharacterized protein Z519_09824 [Cladophialophora bantiana CBS 173.52]KIW89668.1 hypothetical protein Z519_09824 [Cladophialophora bantiana CBS 173.52]
MAANISQIPPTALESMLHFRCFLRPSTRFIMPLHCQAGETCASDIKQPGHPFGIATVAATSTMQRWLRTDALYVDTISVPVALMLEFRATLDFLPSRKYGAAEASRAEV